MNFRRERHIVDLLFVIALLFLFAFSAIMLIALGADVYQKNVNTMQNNYAERTAGAYLVQKMRQADAEGGVRTDTLDGHPAIVLTNKVGDREYATWLYIHENMLCEQLLRADMVPLPAAGQKILPLQSMTIRESADDLMQLDLVLENGETEELYLCLRSEEMP